MAVIIYAPQGEGKSRYAEALQAYFGCSEIVDEWDGKTVVPTGALALTNIQHPEALALATAVAQMKSSAMQATYLGLNFTNTHGE